MLTISLLTALLIAIPFIVPFIAIIVVKYFDQKDKPPSVRTGGQRS